MRIPNQNQLGGRAFFMKRIHSSGDGAGTGYNGVRIADAAAAALAAASGIVDGLRGGTGVRVED